MKIGEPQVSFRGHFVGAVARDLGDGLIQPVLDVLPIFLAANLLGTHDVCAPQVSFFNLLLRFPFSDLRLQRDNLGFLRVACGLQHAIIERGEQLATSNAVSNLHGNGYDASVALGGHVGLLFGNQGAGGGEGSGVESVRGNCRSRGRLRGRIGRHGERCAWGRNRARLRSGVRAATGQK